MSEANVELARQAYDALNRRDLPAFLALMHADVEAVPRVAVIEGAYHGHDGIRRWLGHLVDFLPDIVLDVVTVRDLGDFTVATAVCVAALPVATRRSTRRSGLPPSGVTGSACGGAPTTPKPKRVQAVRLRE